MLSDSSKQIYDILRAITGDDDVYKIIEADEVFEKLPEGVTYTKVQLSSIIKDLKDRDYINVKYFTPDEYCLLTLKRIDEEIPQQSESLLAEEREDSSKKERILYDKNDGKNVKAVKPGIIFLMSFLGALLGSAIIGTIIVVITKFVL